MFKKFTSIIPYIYPPLAISYMEILTRLLCGYEFAQGLVYALIFSFSIGLIISAVFLFNRAAAYVLIGLTGCVFAVSYFMFGAYKVFLSFETIILEANNALAGFAGNVAITFIKGIPVIIGYLLPLFIYIALTRKFNRPSNDIIKTRLKHIAALMAVFLITVLAQIIILNSNSEIKAAFSSEYDFDGTSRRLGILTGLCLDLRYDIFGSPYADTVFAFDTTDFYTMPEESFFEYEIIESPAPGIFSEPQESVLYDEPQESVLYSEPQESILYSEPQESVLYSEPPPPVQDEPPAPQPLIQPTSSTPSSAPPDEQQMPKLADRPITPAKQAPPRPREDMTLFGYNAYNIDFGILINQEKNEKIKTMHEYVSSLATSRQNEYTGIFKGKNLILITSEAFTKEVVHPVITPALYRLVHEGFYFSDYYQPAWGGSTSSGEFSVLTGIVPTKGAKSILNIAGNNLCFTIGNKLQREGYFSASFHNGTHTYYGRDKTHTNFGYTTFKAFGSGFEGFKGIYSSDLDMMRFTMPQYMYEQPFSVYYMTVSGHSSYSKSKNYLSGKNWDMAMEYGEMSDTVRAYMAANLELEYAMQYMLSELESAGILNDTVIAMSTDHYPYGLQQSETWGNSKNYLNELFGFNIVTSADRDHNALVIWSGCLENEYKDLTGEISSPTFSLDILPTLCNLFGLEYDSRLFAGRDIFSNAEPLVFWLDRSFKTDLGYYHAPKKTFTPVSEDTSVSDEYIKIIRNTVNNRITYSEAVVSYDYFNILFDANGTPR